jgi:hypothetical protein
MPPKKKAPARKAEPLSTLRPGDTRIFEDIDDQPVTYVLNFYRKSYVAARQAADVERLAQAQADLDAAFAEVTAVGPVVGSQVFDPAGDPEGDLDSVARNYVRALELHVHRNLIRYGGLFTESDTGYVGVWERREFEDPQDAFHVFETAAEITELLNQPTAGDGVEG